MFFAKHGYASVVHSISQLSNSFHKETALKDLTKCLLPFDDGATVTNLQSELVSVAGQWDQLKASISELYTTKTANEVGSEESENEVKMVNTKV